MAQIVEDAHALAKAQSCGSSASKAKSSIVVCFAVVQRFTVSYNVILWWPHELILILYGSPETLGQVKAF